MLPWLVEYLPTKFGVCHENMGMDFIFEAIDKSFPKESI